MGRVAGGYSVYAKKMLNLGLYPETFREALSEMQLEYFTSEDLNFTINGQTQLLLAKGSLVESVQSFLVLAEESIQGTNPFMVSEVNPLASIPVDKFTYSEGFLQLKVICKVMGPTDVNTVTLKALTTGEEEVSTIRPTFLPTVVDVRSLPVEIQHYLQVDELLIEDAKVQLTKDASDLASLAKKLCEHYKEVDSPLRQQIFGKSLVLSSASQVDTGGDEFMRQALDTELRGSIASLGNLAHQFLVDVYNKNNNIITVNS